MTAPTIARINKAIAHHGVEVVKGNGYFYFADLEGSPEYMAEHIKSVYSCHLRGMSLEQWVSHVDDEIRSAPRD